jgi:hypothetical protein
MLKSIVSEKIGKVIEMAAQLNSSSTSRDVTGNKPTIFVMFSGHVSLFEVQIHSLGWGDAPYDEPDYSWKIYIYEDQENVKEQLDCIINLLEELVERECENG